MNEQIEQLVKRFAEDLMKRSGYDMREYEPFLVESRLFAEKIVRECIKVCAKNKTAFQNESLSAQSQVSRDAWRDKRDGAGECVFSIKQHFGVE